MTIKTPTLVSLLLLLVACGDPGVGSQQQRLDSKPQSADTKPDPAETKPDPAETKPDPAETKPDPAETKPDPGDTKPNPVEAKPEVCFSDAQCGKGEVCDGCDPKAMFCIPGCRASGSVGSACPSGTTCRVVYCVTCPCPAQCQ